MQKTGLIWKDPDAGKDWGQEEKGTTEDEMVGLHHRLRLEVEQALGVGDRQGSLACCSPWGCKDSDMTEWLNWIVPHLFLCPHHPPCPSPDSSKKSWQVRLFSTIFLSIPPASTHFCLQNPCVVMDLILSKSHMLKPLPPVWFYLVIGSLREVVKIKWVCQDAS